jgi:hypothetical protein
MAKTVVELLVDDLDGSEADASVRLGWNGEWRELELSARNLALLSKSIDRYWDAGRPVRATAPSSRSRSRSSGRSSANGNRDPKAIRIWAEENGIAVPSRGRIPGRVEEQYNLAVSQ